MISPNLQMRKMRFKMTILPRESQDSDKCRFSLIAELQFYGKIIFKVLICMHFF